MSALTPAIFTQINRAAGILKNGGIVAYPTDTVYGLGAVFNNIAAVKKIFTVKERPEGMALPLLLSDYSQIELVAGKPSADVMKLADKFFPGALTIIVKKSPFVPDVVTAGAPTVAFRIPDHIITIALIKRTGAPIVGTSANRSGFNSNLTAGSVANQIGDKLDMIIDGGHCPGGKESTIIDMTTGNPTIRRRGAISLELIREVLPETLDM